MSEIFKALADFKERKKFESQRAYAKAISIKNSTHTAHELQEATREYFEASSAFLTAIEIFISLVDKGLI